MDTQTLGKYRSQLLELLNRVAGEIQHVSDAIREEVIVTGDTSSAPVHLADIAEEGVEADVAVLHATRGLMSEIQAALARINEGTYGQCGQCARPIAAERLQAIPYATLCAACAGAGKPPK